ncbi:MAG: hypothetical protein V1906_02695 [Candidatus Woesearchaeota archaeon]
MKELRRQLIEETKVKLEESFDRERLIIHSSRLIDELERAEQSLQLRISSFLQHIKPGAKDISNIRIDEKKIKKEDLQMLKENLALQNEISVLKSGNIDYLSKIMTEIVPRLAEVAGAQLGAKLIDLANGIEKLASMATSKIQVLGAERAMFRHLKTGSKSPKYGVLFMHHSVSGSSDKGKAARKLASEISKAVRVDFYRK